MEKYLFCSMNVVTKITLVIRRYCYMASLICQRKRRHHHPLWFAWAYPRPRGIIERTSLSNGLCILRGPNIDGHVLIYFSSDKMQVLKDSWQTYVSTAGEFCGNACSYRHPCGLQLRRIWWWRINCRPNRHVDRKPDFDPARAKHDSQLHFHECRLRHD
jgi:hypothetical protein